MNKNIRLTMVLSTGHVTEATAKLLNSTSNLSWNVLGGPYRDYGWFVWCATEQGDIPEDMWTCMVYARAQGCEHILFDRDEVPDPALAFYGDW